jgi:putative ABC transport system permease protein
MESAQRVPLQMVINAFRHDLAFALRSLLRGRLVSAIAVLSLAIGIAANTTAFSLVQALEFPNLIYPDASRIVFLESRNDARGIDEMMLSEPDARDIAAATRTLVAVSISAQQSSILRIGTAARRVQGRRVEPGFFDLLRVPPATGRVFSGDDDQGVIVLSDSLWREQFGADAAIIGQPIRLDGGVTTVVGVMPRLFDGDADFWTPLGRSIAGARRDDRQFELLARVAPGRTLDDVRVELTALSTRLAAERPETNRQWQMYATPLARLHGRDARQSFLLLQAAVGFVLLIACANIANILLARGVERRREIAVRIAIGASRGRLMASMMTEAIVLSAAGGALGVLASMWGIRFARSVGGFPDVIEPHLNLPVLAFVIAVTAATGVICGLAPALRASAVAPEPILREAGRGTTDRSVGRLGAALVVAQVAGALMLATCAALLLRSFINRERVTLGFEPRGAFRADVSLPFDRYGDPARIQQALDRIIAAASSDPAIAAAGVRTWALPTGAGAQRQFTLPRHGDAALAPGVRRNVDAVTPDYFRAMGMQMQRGRAFTNADRAGSEPVAIVNEELARRLWPDGGAVGSVLRLGTPGEQAPVVAVVGVVATLRRSPMHDSPLATAYVPYAQYPNGTFTIVARGRGDAAAAVRAIETAVRSADGELLAENVKTLDADVGQFMAPLRFVTEVLTGFAAAAVLLAGLGVFGMMSYSVVQRYHEIAVRSALGADRAAILRLVLGGALRLTAAGVLIGALLSALAARALRVYLFGVTPTDPFTYAVVAAVLPLLSLAACWRPARAAAGVDPMALLRQ